MAKKFLGFNPEQQFTILSKMGYEGPKESSMMEAYAASNPAAASKLSDYSRRAQELLNGPQMAEGGVVSSNSPATYTVKKRAGDSFTLQNGDAFIEGFGGKVFKTEEAANAALNKIKSGVPVAEVYKEYNSPTVTKVGNYFSLQDPAGFQQGQFASAEEANKFAAAQAAGETGPLNVSLGTNNTGQAVGNYTTTAATPTGNVATTTNVTQPNAVATPQSVAGGGTSATYTGTPTADGKVSYDNKSAPMEFATAPAYTAPGQMLDLGGSKDALAKMQEKLSRAAAASQANPDDASLRTALEGVQKEYVDAQNQFGVANKQYATTNLPTSAEAVGTAINDPMSLVTQPEVANIQTSPEQEISADAGQVSADAPTATATKVGTAAQATTPVATPTSLIEATKVSDNVPAATAVTGELSEKAQVDAAQGKLSPEAMAEASTVDPKFIDKVTSGQLQVGANELTTPAGQNAKAIQAEVAQSAGIAAVVAEQGTVKPEELPEPALIKEEDMAQAQAITASGLAPDAIAVAARLEKFTVDNETLAQAMQGEVSALDTVQGQLTELMKSFDDGATPAWAAGAIRAANAAMASRGLGGSSMAGAAVFQAAMESALPIASQDAQVFAQMNLTNLNNRQQVALANAAAQQGLQLQNLNNEQQAALQNSSNAFALQSQNLSNMQQTMIANAQIKAALQGQNLSNQQQSNLATAARYAEMSDLNLNNRQQVALQNNANALNIELANVSNKQQAYIANAQLAASLQGKQIDNEQQASVVNAARFAEAANITFTAEQQTALHNSELMKTVGLAELNTKQAATLQNAANLANLDITNLNNRQQAAVQNAQAFLQMDMTNLNNEQQTEIFNTQGMIQAMFSDQAAENAAKQFNAASENQVTQFFAGLAESVSRFNADQVNTIAQFDAGSENATEQFNSNMKSLREQFNAQNSLLIAQANAQWRQNISTIDTAALNEANMVAAKVASGLTADGMAQFWQREKDLMSYAFTASENDANRNLSLILGDKEIQAKIDMQNAALDFQDNIAKGEMISNLFDW